MLGELAQFFLSRKAAHQRAFKHAVRREAVDPGIELAGVYGVGVPGVDFTDLFAVFKSTGNFWHAGSPSVVSINKDALSIAEGLRARRASADAGV